MQELKSETVVIVKKSVIEQVLELPVGSIVTIERGGLGTGVLAEVLQRTGMNGWLSTRREAYRNNDKVRSIISDALAADARVVLLRRGEKDYV